MKAPLTSSVRLTAGGFLLTAILVLFSRRFLDERIALFFDRLLRSSDLLSQAASEIPDILLPLVAVLSGAMWAFYILRVREGRRDDRTRFFRLAGTALPVAYVAKTAIKKIFGQMNARAWLDHPADRTFHWFQGGGELSSFPSGHMTVFMSLAVACWLFFPGYRRHCLSFMAVLGVAMIATGYHFLSDVIAGGYLGLVVGIWIDQVS